MTITRRELARGTAWAAPMILATAAAPAMAASPCAVYRTGQSLPASAFEVTYLDITTDGGGTFLENRQLNIDFGFKISAQAKACGVTTGTIASTDGSRPSRAQLNRPTNPTNDMTNGFAIPANGTVGQLARLCRFAVNGTEACGSTGGTRYSVANTRSSNDYYFTVISLSRAITVAGYGTSQVYFNANMPTTGTAPFRGFGFSVTPTSPI